MSNPYQSPSPNAYQPLGAPGYVPSDPGYGWVNQIRIFAVLNAVQGVLEVLMALLYISMAFFVPAMMQLERANNPNVRQPPEELFWFMLAVYGGMGLAVLVAAILRLCAAWSNYKYRGRTLAIVSVVGGMLSMLGCYCAPTAVALLVWGLILMLNPAVKAAFEMGEQGYAPDQILAAFMPYRQPMPGTPPNNPFQGIPPKPPPGDGFGR
jgi:hypothetical protein